MRLRIVAFLAAFFAFGSPFLSAAPREVEVGSKMAEDCTVLLDQLLGPGRAKVIVRVQGEQSEVKTQTELLTPAPGSAAGKPNNPIPGFGIYPFLDKEKEMLQRDQEQSTRTGPFVIRKIEAFVVLDQQLPAPQVRAIQRILSDLLRIDQARGDTLTMIPVAVQPAWKSAFMSPEGIRTLGLWGAAAFLLLTALIGLYVFVVRPASRALEAVAARRAAQAPMPGPAAPAGFPPAPAQPQADARRIPRLDRDDVIELGEEPAQLGQRFGFLTARPPEEIAELLREETPGDLALLFGSLTEANPAAAAELFRAMPAELQGETSRALAKLKLADPERLAMLENRLKTQVDYQVRGTQRLGSILSRLPPEERRRVLDGLTIEDPEAAAKVGKDVFSFEDLLALPAAELRALVPEVPLSEWAAALKGVAQGLVDRIAELLPAEVRQGLSEEMAAAQPARAVAARSKILTQAAALAKEGRLKLPGGGSPLPGAQASAQRPR